MEERDKPFELFSKKSKFDEVLEKMAKAGWTAYEGREGLYETKFNTDGTGRFLDVKVRTKEDLIATYSKGGTLEVELVPYVIEDDFTRLADEEGLEIPEHKIAYHVFTRPKQKA